MSLSKLLNFSFIINGSVRCLSRSTNCAAQHSCKLLIVGGGAGGCTIAAKLCGKRKKHEIIVVEPCDMHYNQAHFTLVAGGMKTLESTRRLMGAVLPKNITWLKDSVEEYCPKDDMVTTRKGDTITYDHMLVASGLQLNFDEIPGFLDALECEESSVCTNYSPRYVNKTLRCLKRFKQGNAIFTLPNTPLKCPGAPQKAAYIADAFFRKNNKRTNANVIYNTSLPVLFGVKKYCDALWLVVKERDIDVNLRTNLVSIEPGKNIATFQNLDEPNETYEIDYEMLNATPPMYPPDGLRACEDLVNAAGYVDVDKHTLQSTRFENVFAIGDCGSTPNSKTAAAVASQSNVVAKNLTAAMERRTPEHVYNGYASCPLVTGYSKCILAEFDYDLTPMETFPINQAKERRLMFLFKKELMPHLYWLMLKGYWGGPKTIRKIMHLGFA